MMKNWNGIKEKLPEGRKLIKTIFFTHKKELLKTLGILICGIILFSMRPFLTLAIIDYISNHKGDITYGL